MGLSLDNILLSNCSHLLKYPDFKYILVKVRRGYSIYIQYVCLFLFI